MKQLQQTWQVRSSCHTVLAGLLFFLCSLANASGFLGARASEKAPPVGLLNPPQVRTMELPDEVRLWFFNTDGSCVQCSGGMVGVRNNLPAWTFLLFNTDEYGPAQRGGSGPDRVARYARARGMRLFNVTGRSTYEYMEWAAKTGRFAAIGAFSGHFQTHYGRDFTPAAEKYFVCNNWPGQIVTSYSQREFERVHEASGLWCFVPDEPACPPVHQVVEWWK